MSVGIIGATADCILASTLCLFTCTMSAQYQRHFVPQPMYSDTFAVAVMSGLYGISFSKDIR